MTGLFELACRAHCLLRNRILGLGGAMRHQLMRVLLAEEFVIGKYRAICDDYEVCTAFIFTELRI